MGYNSYTHCLLKWRIWGSVMIRDNSKDGQNFTQILHNRTCILWRFARNAWAHGNTMIVGRTASHGRSTKLSHHRSYEMDYLSSPPLEEHPPPPTAHHLSLPWAVCLALPQELRINLRSVSMLQLDALFFVCSEGSSSWHVTWCYVVMSNPTPFSLVGGICYERLEWRVLLHSSKLEIFLGHLRRLAVTFVYEHFNFHIYSKT